MHSSVRDEPLTVRVTTLKGLDAGLYYVEGLPSYYLDGDEPPGRWLGEAATSLGLAGEVVDEDFLALMAGRHPVSGGHLGRRYGERSVRGFDVTASAPKSVSVLFALGDDQVRGAVLDAQDATVTALARWIEGHAHTRYRVDGQVVIVDAQGIAAAAFRQHVSRSLDPQLHTHLVLPNRVIGPDGRWLALDARTLKCDQRTLSALYHAGLRAELTKSLGVRWQMPVNGIAEIDGVAVEVLDEFSSRTKAVAERTEDKLDRFTETFGRDPTPRERWRLEREAVIDSRPAKAHGTDAESLHQDWAERTLALGHHPERVVADALSIQPAEHQMDLFSEELIAVHALDALVERQSAWRPAEVVRELAAAVPTDTGMTAERLLAWVEGLAETVIARSLVDLSAPIPDGVALRRDGRPVTEAVTARALTNPDVLAQEEELLAWADHRLAQASTPEADVVLRAPELSGPQLDLAAAAAGNATLVLAVGPAGSGKTTALAPAVAELASQGKAVFGVAPSAAAAEVLAGTGMATDTLDKLLVEHRHGHMPAPPYDLAAGATVVLDEAAMVSNPKLAELAALADRQNWRVVLVGDPLQFSAVGRGGMFAHLVETCGAIELDRVRRFANPWERDASLRLRRGDASVLDLYEAQVVSMVAVRVLFPHALIVTDAFHLTAGCSPPLPRYDHAWNRWRSRNRHLGRPFKNARFALARPRDALEADHRRVGQRQRLALYDATNLDPDLAVAYELKEAFRVATAIGRSGDTETFAACLELFDALRIGPGHRGVRGGGQDLPGLVCSSTAASNGRLGLLHQCEAVNHACRVESV